ncbi:MAG: AMP-binding protein, partial [Acidimicrobiia bacterium]
SSKRFPERFSIEAVQAKLNPRDISLPMAPLMHGTGSNNSFSILDIGGSIVLAEGRSFDPIEVLDLVQRERVSSLCIIGDAMCKPMLSALDAEPQRWDLSALRVIMSSGVMWSMSSKEGLLRHNPKVMLVDTLGSTEAVGTGSAVSTAGNTSAVAKFRLGPTTKVLTEDGREVMPGSGERGRIANGGRIPMGYYKDPEKSAGTFVVYEGHRWSVVGDWATVEADGSITLLGRGSQVINTGGEKVYPEEVEEVIKTHPSVHDCVVVGVPDDRFGQAITANVELEPGAALDEAAIIAHVKAHLAGFKAPKRVLQVDTIGRAPNAKVDYKRHTAIALERLGLS